MFYMIQRENMHHTMGNREEDIIYVWKSARVARQGRDRKRALAFGAHRILDPSKYNAVFFMFLKGEKGTNGQCCYLDHKSSCNRQKKPTYISESCKIFSQTWISTVFTQVGFKKTIVELIVFYGGAGEVGLDYVEFNHV